MMDGPMGIVPGALSLRVSVTDRCQLRCEYCMPPEGVIKRSHPEIMRYEEIAEFVRILAGLAPVGKVRLTGGEPLVRPDIEQLVALLANLHIPDLALTTNGQLLAGLARPLKASGLVRVNVSLDSLNEQTYRKLTRGGVLGRTLEGIDEALHCGLLPLKLNMVVLRGVNDPEILDMVEFAVERGVEMRFLEVMPIGTARDQHRERLVSSAEIKAAIQTRYRLEPVLRDAGSTSVSFSAMDGAGRIGRVGFISACSEPFCHDCNRLRLTSDGRLIGCLAADIGVPVRALLASGAEGRKQLEETVRLVLAGKKVRGAFCQTQLMAAIGG
ncbi:MAG: GTP 3',8-cyclase MoaA [Verrucomicrobia bacterium]|nr:GTP 3',8-cyclase MoaA [Verrucomicrobiota bacterium]